MGEGGIGKFIPLINVGFCDNDNGKRDVQCGGGILFWEKTRGALWWRGVEVWWRCGEGVVEVWWRRGGGDKRLCGRNRTVMVDA